VSASTCERIEPSDEALDALDAVGEPQAVDALAGLIDRGCDVLELVDVDTDDQEHE
jgi:hypothetical protein